MKESKQSFRSGREQARQGNFDPLGSCLRAGIYRSVPELAYELDDSRWEKLCEDSREFSHPNGGTFAVSLFEAGGDADDMLGDDVTADLADGRKALVHHEDPDGIVSSSVVDLSTGQFVAKHSSGVLHYYGNGNVTVEAFADSRVQDVTAGCARFIKDFVASTPEFDSARPEPEPATAQIGAIAVAGIQTTTA